MGRKKRRLSKHSEFLSFSSVAEVDGRKKKEYRVRAQREKERNYGKISVIPFFFLSIPNLIYYFCAKFMKPLFYIAWQM